MNFQLVEFLKCDSAVLAGIIEDGTSRFAFWFHINFKAKAINDDFQIAYHLMGRPIIT